jgi:hypothetical protein
MVFGIKGNWQQNTNFCKKWHNILIALVHEFIFVPDCFANLSAFVIVVLFNKVLLFKG